MLFGEKGFAAASTREIATAADANIGSIAYHFGGKNGLYRACAEHIVETIGSIAGGALNAAMLAGIAKPEDLLCAVVERVVPFIITSREAGVIVQFVLRELQHPGAALDTIYGGVFEPVHRRLCGVWEMATGEPADSEAARLTVFTLIGQIVYFRIGREAVRRRMDWDSIGPEEAQAIVKVAQANIRAIVAARKESLS